MTSKINKATTAYGKWWIRQLLRSAGTIYVVNEFGPKTSNFGDTVKTFTLMKIYQDLMTDDGP